MKTTIVSLASIFALTWSSLCAANPTAGDEKNSGLKSESELIYSAETMHQLAPVTPAEATFEDLDSVNFQKKDQAGISKLAPETPVEASFDEILILPSIRIAPLAPETPQEASFEETEQE
jgi:hypothetical protein